VHTVEFGRVRRTAASWLSACLVALAAMAFVGCERELPPPPPLPQILEVELLEIDPPAPARVDTASRLNVRIGYRSDLPITFSLEPLIGDVVLSAGTSGSPAWPAGEGEAYVSFFLFQPGSIDALRIHVGHANGRGRFRAFDFPIDAEFVRGAARSAAEAPWVARLQARASALQAEQRPPPSNGGAGELVGGVLMIYGMFAVLILAAVLPIVAIKRWEGGWRLGAWIALGIYALPVLNVVIDVIVDPRSHNLWPLELLGYALATLALGTLLYLLRRAGGSSRPRRAAGLPTRMPRDLRGSRHAP
jgi:hypothetical protein